MAGGARLRFSLAFLTVSALAAAAFPALASAGTIAGTVSEAGGSLAPLEGVEVCAHGDPVTPGPHPPLCTATDAGGHYALAVDTGSYRISFSDEPRNRNFVDRSYGTSVTVTNRDEVIAGIDAQLEDGSTIMGKVTDLVTGVPLAGIPVCAVAAAGVGGRCTSSGRSGSYAINGLAPGRYTVEFLSGQLNFQPQLYGGGFWPDPGTQVEIAGRGETRAGIDAAMRAGVEFTGRVTEAGSDAPLPGIHVELIFVGQLRPGSVTSTGSNGDFRFWGLGDGDYEIAYSKSLWHFNDDADCFAVQYYKGSDGGTPPPTILHGVPGVPITGVDAELVPNCAKPGPPPLQVTISPATTPMGAVKRPLRCRKGSHRKRVKGKVRCVKRQQRHRHQRRDHRHPHHAHH